MTSMQHYFGAELRYWRHQRRLSLAQLGRTLYVSADLIGKVEKAQRWPRAALVNECEAVLGSGGILPRLYALAADERSASGARAHAEASVSLVRLAAIMVVLLVQDVVDPFDAANQSDALPVRASGVTHLRSADHATGGVADLAAVRGRRTCRLPSGATAVARRR